MTVDFEPRHWHEFDRAGYGTGEIGWGTTPAVLAVDFQATFVSADYPVGRSPHVASALATAGRRLGRPHQRRMGQ